MRVTNTQRQRACSYLTRVYLDAKESPSVRLQALNAHAWLNGTVPTPLAHAAELRELVLLITNKRLAVGRADGAPRPIASSRVAMDAGEGNATRVIENKEKTMSARGGVTA